MLRKYLLVYYNIITKKIQVYKYKIQVYKYKNWATKEKIKKLWQNIYSKILIIKIIK